MTVSSIIRHKVNDFATWKKGYDESAQMLKDGGVITDSVHRDIDDPNLVVVYHQYADESTAKAYLAMVSGDQFQAIVQELGIDMETMELWLVEDVE